MGTDISVVIAFRDLGDRHRRASFDYITRWYSALGCEIVVEPGDPTRPFSRAAAINTAVHRAAGQVIVQSDPDSLVDLDRVHAAVALAAAADGLVIPHDRYLYLNRSVSDDIVDGGLAPGEMLPDDCDDYGPNGMGNVVVFSAATWFRAGGFDERFEIWGGDDAAWAYACDAFCGPARRLSGDMWHLWHPRLPQSVPGHPGYIDQMAILGQYRDAAAVGPAAVRNLVRNR